MHNHIVEMPSSKESRPESVSAPPPSRATTNANDDSVAVHSAANSGNMIKLVLRHAYYFLEGNWKRVWVMVLWISMCLGLFAWKFVQYRHHTLFDVMGYSVCVTKGCAETCKN
jgi:hypothetical protein